MAQMRYLAIILLQVGELIELGARCVGRNLGLRILTLTRDIQQYKGDVMDGARIHSSD